MGRGICKARLQDKYPDSHTEYPDERCADSEHHDCGTIGQYCHCGADAWCRTRGSLQEFCLYDGRIGHGSDGIDGRSDVCLCAGDDRGAVTGGEYPGTGYSLPPHRGICRAFLCCEYRDL